MNCRVIPTIVVQSEHDEQDKSDLYTKECIEVSERMRKNLKNKEQHYAIKAFVYLARSAENIAWNIADM